ncbi:uncharacterized protein N7496_006079 [Penicillium cataractarum]|uniref:Uncharacterized protein n=1 Tax=Penicillium cataractarum TaxID=2100454 RepID=A0A9W9V603_9EURO|nr:uncharacterized protein N7496_006079 [Penicillium cataractarum]KAJ5369987.1 hypothetical protein N7496_006079 [Penicillium cataractarum]
MGPDYDKKNTVLRRILENASNNIVCPLQAENTKSEYGILQDFQDSVSEFQHLLAIAEKSGIVFVCPQCVDVDFEYFDKMNEFRFHCWKKQDERHMGFVSFDQSIFNEAYCKAIGGDFQTTKPRTREDMIQIAYVFKNKIVRVSEYPHNLI